MAQPIPYRSPKYDPRAELEARLAVAPAAHAEAMLAAYEVLQGLHDRGVFEVLHGLLGSGNKVLDLAVQAANRPGAIDAVRNLVLLANMLGEIDPEVMVRCTRAVAPALRRSIERPDPRGLWGLVRKLLGNQDLHRGMATLSVLIEELGRGIHGDNSITAATARKNPRGVST
jgi:hypothetical protein